MNQNSGPTAPTGVREAQRQLNNLSRFVLEGLPLSLPRTSAVFTLLEAISKPFWDFGAPRGTRAKPGLLAPGSARTGVLKWLLVTDADF